MSWICHDMSWIWWYVLSWMQSGSQKQILHKYIYTRDLENRSSSCFLFNQEWSLFPWSVLTASMKWAWLDHVGCDPFVSYDIVRRFSGNFLIILVFINILFWCYTNHRHAVSMRFFSAHKTQEHMMAMNYDLSRNGLFGDNLWWMLYFFLGGGGILPLLNSNMCKTETTQLHRAMYIF